MRSLFPKIRHFKQDFHEREVDFNLLCEIWEKSLSKRHLHEMEKMLELDGLKYLSTPRTHKGGGGVAIVCNQKKLSVKKLPIKMPSESPYGM